MEYEQSGECRYLPEFREPRYFRSWLDGTHSSNRTTPVSKHPVIIFCRTIRIWHVRGKRRVQDAQFGSFAQ